MEQVTDIAATIKFFLESDRESFDSYVPRCITLYDKKGTEYTFIYTRTVFDKGYPILGYVKNNVFYKTTPKDWDLKGELHKLFVTLCEIKKRKVKGD